MKNPLLLLLASLALLCSAIQVQGQERAISGTVVSAETGDPLIGASVLVKGASTGTITDVDGGYSLNVPENATLVVSYVGYNTIEEAVGNRATIDFQLSEGQQLEEVVVTALGISREKKALGYAVQELSSDEIMETREANIVNSLQGKVAGVLINSASGAPGAGSNIIIRGITSFGGNNQPLFVVDGIPIDNSTIAGGQLPSAGSNAFASSEQASFSNRAADINPSDIESMTILKGPSATALYGIRAANGVVVITTKQGQAGRAQVTLNTSFGIEELAKAPTYQEGYREGFDGRLRFNSDGSPLRFQAYGPKVYPGQTPVFDLFDDFFQTGFRQDHSLGISGGNERATYSSSFSYLRHEGITPFSDWGRLNARLAGTFKVSDKLSVGGSVSYSNSGGNRPHSGDKSIMSSLSYHPLSFDVNDYIAPDGSMIDYSNGIIDNPRYLAEFSTLIDDVDRTLGNINFNYQAAPWLNFTYRVGLDNYTDSRVRTVPAGLDLSSQTGGFLIEEDIRSRQINSTLLATATKALSPDFNLEVSVGHDLNDRFFERTNVRGEGFTVPDFYHLSNTERPFVENFKSQRRIFGVLGLLKLSAFDALFLDITGRNDWSSTLPEQNRSFFYPSFSLSAVASELFVMPDFITFAKLRASYAEVAKDTDPYLIGSLFEGDPSFPFTSGVTGAQVNGFRQSSVVGDANLRPETTASIEFGTDLRFFSNRLRFDVTWFKQNSRDQILQVPVTNTTGFSRFVTNAGEIENRGLEVLVGVTPLETKDFSWDISVNYSRITGEVISISEGIEEIELFGGGFGGVAARFVPGGKVGDLYGFQYERAPDGQLLIGDDGFPFIRTDTTYLIGNALPDFTAGLTNTFRWKGISLSFLLEWRQGGDLYDLGLRNSIRNGVLAETERRHEQVIFQGVTASGEPNTQPVEIDGNTFYRNSVRHNRAAENILQDGSWLRLRRVSIGYQLPKTVLGGGGFISAARISLTGNNLIINTPFRGFDPETNYFGAGSDIYGYTGLQSPGVRSYTAALNITF
jgi:TonB-linked SusC/RagA family outer membrane protein